MGAPRCRIRARVQGRVAASVAVLPVVLLTGGCGFVSALAHPDVAPTGVAESSASGATDETAVATTASATAAIASAAADLVASSYARPASLKVTVAVQKGVPPVPTMQGSLALDCHLPADDAEYATVTLVFTDRGPADSKEQVHTLGHVIGSNLRLDLSVAGGPGLGVFDLTINPTGYCNGDPVLPTRTTLQSQDLAGEHQSMTVYVLARVGAADPDPLHGATLQIRDPRRHPDALNPDSWTWHVKRVTAGSACPGDPDSLCVPLG